ncbi:agc/rsk/rsk-unclassified protein kinase [Saprolegnia parasitica CBS 223.65]|uniref:non-specific serine/threonine protein kinase n=1 Tax=Saprolegnia parasitica (strain CBS 223.65) TaxID=695850 RepID=A0A067CPQ9_SAPPC|nr:agc/rsk/rsk-unclassified protein kinase [Saprolegnia parasitica CBS 223.65]KDO31195.1 agc/rsk/rsk-unclassified protein kinase [Saprolegnia parasitica CBS 223.65]|eukprot:XP_012197800.1 agc/rsk/rsk-unclassified protein kinase [Saprolegnia parasitica CBS 223.65]
MDSVGVHHFEKLRLLRSGGYARVYLVQSKGLLSNGVFAMKIMEKALVLRRHYELRVLNEREILAKIAHPFVTKLYYAFQTKRYLYLVMQYCPGGPLQGFLTKARYLSETAVQFYAAELVVVLEYLHTLGIVHRDLTPNNILVHETGHLILCDFGNASRLDRSMRNFAATCKRRRRQQLCCCPNQVKPQDAGTYDLGPSSAPPTPPSLRPPKHIANDLLDDGECEYTAPEGFQNALPSTALDWWALGIIMFQMLFGTTPFQGTNDEETKRNILHQDLFLPIAPAVSPACRDLLFLLLEKDATLRMLAPSTLKAHAFFKSINWALVRHRRPPMSPPALDLSTMPSTATQHFCCDYSSTEGTEPEVDLPGFEHFGFTYDGRTPVYWEHDPA